MINIFKSSRVWKNKPTIEDMRSTVDPGTDPIVRLLPPDKVKAYLKIAGARLSYSGGAAPRYMSELLYYIDESGAFVFGELPPGDPISLT